VILHFMTAIEAPMQPMPGNVSVPADCARPRSRSGLPLLQDQALHAVSLWQLRAVAISKSAGKELDITELRSLLPNELEREATRENVPSFLALRRAGCKRQHNKSTHNFFRRRKIE
jgi:hypothetical protein